MSEPMTDEHTVSWCVEQLKAKDAEIERLREALRLAWEMSHMRTCSCPRSWPRAGHHHEDCHAAAVDAFRAYAQQHGLLPEGKP